MNKLREQTIHMRVTLRKEENTKKKQKKINEKKMCNSKIEFNLDNERNVRSQGRVRLIKYLYRSKW